MRLDLTNVEEKSYLKAGNHFVKVIKQEETFSHNGKPILKVTFANKSGAQISDDFYLTEQAMFRIKLLTKALKMPNVLDTELMINRYVNIEVVEEPYQDRNGNNKIAYKVSSYEEATQTNTLEQKDALLPVEIVVKEPLKQQHNIPDIDINDDEIPFSGGTR